MHKRYFEQPTGEWQRHTRDQLTHAFVTYMICNCVNVASAIGTDPSRALLAARLAMCNGRRAREPHTAASASAKRARTCMSMLYKHGVKHAQRGNACHNANHQTSVVTT